VDNSVAKKLDCAGVCGGNSSYDCEGTCGGDKQIDCLGICGGTARRDCNGVCEGQDSYDCAGNCGGNQIIDCKGSCVSPELAAKYDCHGVCDGDSKIDCDGNCIGPCEEGNFNCAPNCDKDIDCEKVCGGDKIVDCSGSCVEIDSALYRDADGICGGDNILTNCVQKVDCRGVCGGKTLVDCDGVCGGSNFDCPCTQGYDCFGICGGTARPDCLGVCGGTASYDCNGVCNGTSKIDCDGLCGGFNFTCACEEGFDCSMVCGGDSIIDQHNICRGNNNPAPFLTGTLETSHCNSPVLKSTILYNMSIDPLCPYGIDSCGTCGGDVVNPDLCPETPIVLDFGQHQHIDSLNPCGQLVNGEEIYVDACGKCLGSEFDINNCSSTPTFTPYLHPEVPFIPTCPDNSCGFDYNGNCYTVDACGVCGGTETDISNCRNIEPVNDCDYWLVTWTTDSLNGQVSHSAWVRDPHQGDFLYQDSDNFYCYKPKSAIGPMCPPENYVFYSGGYLPCSGQESVLVSNTTSNPFGCEYDPNANIYPGSVCGVNSWGGCIYVDQCGICDGPYDSILDCPGYSDETTTSCYLVKGVWKDINTNKMYSAWIDDNNSELKRDFYFEKENYSTCFVLYGLVDIHPNPLSCEASESDQTPLYLTPYPECGSKTPTPNSSSIHPFNKANCLISNNSVSINNGKYQFQTVTSLESDSKYSMGVGKYNLTIPESHPIFLEGFDGSKITISSNQSISGDYGVGYFGDVVIEVFGDFETISYKCAHHGYMGGKDNLTFNSSCSNACTIEKISSCSDQFSITS
jgi:hypothetical protein